MKTNTSIEYIGAYEIKFHEILTAAGLNITMQDGCWDKSSGTAPMYGPAWIKEAVDKFYEIGNKQGWSADMLNDYGVMANYIIGCSPDKDEESDD